MKIKLYQIEQDRDAAGVCFMSLNHLYQYQETKKIDFTIYDKVFAGSIAGKTLEDVYARFNSLLGYPEGYAGRSMSVSDIVEVISGAREKPGFYYCDSIGFKPVKIQPAQTA